MVKPQHACTGSKQAGCHMQQHELQEILQRPDLLVEMVDQREGGHCVCWYVAGMIRSGNMFDLGLFVECWVASWSEKRPRSVQG